MPTAKSNTKMNEEVILSKQVSYHYKEENGKRTDEGLMASDRFYPGVLVNRRFYSGVHHKNRFLPGFVACGRFIPGLVTKRGFFPGLATANSFQPGIIAMGVFMPGIVEGENFVPGISNAHGFLPGSFTTDSKFMPGRFVNGHFECGIIDGHNFIPEGNDRLVPRDAHALTLEGYGLAKVRRYEPIGGLPITGVVVGYTGNMPSFVPDGLMTNAGVILGGLYGKENIPTLDPDAALEQLGIEVDEAGDLLDLDNRFDEMTNDLSDGLFNPFTFEQSRTSLEEALEQLGQGENELIDKMNNDQAEYWTNVFGRNAGGMISGTGGTNSPQGWNSDEFAKRVGAGAVSGASGGLLGGIMGGPAGMFVGGVIGGVTGAFTGAAEYVVERGIEAIGTLFGGTSTPDGEDGDGNGFYIQPQHAPLGASVTRDTVLTIKQEGLGVGGRSAITISQTDAGALVVINYAEMAFAARNSADRRINLRLNLLTGNATLITPLTISQHDRVGRAMHQMYENLVTHPLETA